MDIKSIGLLLFRNTGRRQTLLKNVFWLAISEVVPKGMIVLLTIAIVRYLGPEEYGRFAFAFAFAAIFSVIADFGLTTLTTKEVACNVSLGKKYIDNIIIIKIILGVLAFGSIVLSFVFLKKPASTEFLICLAGIWVITQSFVQFFQSIFRAFEKMEYEALSKAVYALVLVIIASSAMYLGLGSAYLIKGYVVASLIGAVITLFLIRKKFTKFWVEIDFSFWKSLIKEAWPFALFTVFALVYFEISIVMLSIIKNDLVVGLYSIAFNSIVVFFVLADIVAGSVLPILSKMGNEMNLFKQLTKKLIVVMFGLGFCLAVLLFIGASFFVGLVYGKSFAGVVIPFRIMVWILPLRFASYVFGVSLVAAGLQKKRLIAVIICALFSILLNLILIQTYGLIGAAIATLATEGILFALYLSYYKTISVVRAVEACKIL